MWTRFKQWRAERWRARNLDLGSAEDSFPRKRYRFYQIGFFVLLLGFGMIVYTHYDYWVFRILIAGNYIFTDDLDALYAQHIREENRRGFHRDFDRVMISVFTAAIREINQDRYTYLYSPQAFAHTREQQETIARRANVTPLTDDTVYLWVPNISRWSRQFVMNHRDELAGYANLVLDLRYNTGGLLADFHRIANLFVPRGAVLGYEETRLRFFTRTITSRGNPVFEFDNIIILQNRRTASAAEGLIQALAAHVPGVVTIGENTFGKGIGQITVPLTGGYAVRASVLMVYGPDRVSIHNVGITPDIPGAQDMDWVEQALALLMP